jgi:hypothetical protein
VSGLSALSFFAFTATFHDAQLQPGDVVDNEPLRVEVGVACHQGVLVGAFRHDGS